MTEIGTDSSGQIVTLPGRTDSHVTIAWSAGTDTGKRRSSNQDSYLAQSPIFAVADGMGGHSSGDLASGLVVERLAEISAADFLGSRDVQRALEAASRDISEIAGDIELGVGTTVTGAVLTMSGEDAYFSVFNIGDSRVYVYDHNALTQVTVDHSVVQEMVDSGMIAADEAEQHPQSNVITRAVGFNAVPVADFWMLPVTVGLRLLICSDGLTKELNSDRLRDQLAAGLTPAQTVGALIDAALAAGGRDNVTAIVVDIVEAPDHPAPVEAAAVAPS